MREERQAQALPFLRQAHQLQPTHPDATCALPDAEFHAGTAGDALPLWREVVAARPGDVNARLRLGETLNRLVLLDEEIANYEIGRAHVSTPVSNAPLVFPPPLAK